MRWFLVFLLVFLIFNRAGAWLQKLGLGRLPGDLRFSIFGREFFLPLASSVVLTVLASIIMMVF
ncbi:MAG: hypothetical protein CFE46_03230 [Burkholderiales bacterium PBB6]|jgi:hypothetical protein|uniref:DUF2905 domain-containing protein n=1 Tax=Ideonella margarita TaxID=2984191 RepID=A0ABU9BYZ6_9BURK|nr:MAG: hypothetical protein CFE46_03230 [Burkholderiales bacterium PBB6]